MNSCGVPGAILGVGDISMNMIKLLNERSLKSIDKERGRRRKREEVNFKA